MCNNNSQILTPFQRKFLRLKQEAPEGYVLLVRLGDFYDTFGDDAKRAAPLLGTALTHRAGWPMTGFPVLTIDGMLARLVRASIGVALAERMDIQGGLPAHYEITKHINP